MINRSTISAIVIFLATSIGCSKESKPSVPSLPVVAYLQVFEDATLSRSKQGFYDALKEGGFEDGKTMKLIFRNSQGDNATMNQALDYFISEKVSLIATNPTIATIAAVQKSRTIPICMMVSPRPDLAGLALSDGSYPKNLFGVYETLAYIDTSATLIKKIFPKAKRVGAIFNSSEPNAQNAMARLRNICKALNLELIESSVTATNESQQVALSLTTKKIDVFFALPDNIIFASFETIYKVMIDKKIPIVSSEVGLIERGAVMGYGADFYEWGRQSGRAAAKFLKGDSTALKPEEVIIRKRVYNEKSVEALKINVPAGFVKF
jgi:putative tryptophan/tyrosine transport system substrate-binding protein